MPKTPKPKKKPAERIVTVKAYGIFCMSDDCPCEVVPRDWGPKPAKAFADRHYQFADVRPVTITYKTKLTRKRNP